MTEYEMIRWCLALGYAVCDYPIITANDIRCNVYHNGRKFLLKYHDRTWDMIPVE